MKFSEQWLRSLAEPGVSREELVARLSMVGLEVDAVTPVAGRFDDVVVAEVSAVEPHPDADKLRVCQVSDGAQTVQVVCGAPNVRPGLRVPFARIGAELPGGLKIKKAKLRGVESQGMLCSAAELDLSEDHSGLMEFASDAPVGQSVRDYLRLDDVSIEIGLTPNRGDCLSLRGLAREVGAIYQVPVREPAIEPVVPSIDTSRPVEILAPQACPRYLGRVISGIDLSRPTPGWMAERLRRSGIRSIDAVVDITNYVMLELGQPMHAFDLEQIRGGIRVRLAGQDERLTLLDGQDVTLSEKTLVIADHERPLAIAGVMGGEHSGISESTTSLFLESAYFDPIALAGTARSYGLHTDASHRYERGVDPQLARQAIERATELVLAIVGGSAGPVVEAADEAVLPKPADIELRRARIEQVLGLSLEDVQVERILQGLGFGLVAQEAGWRVSVPSHRFDVSIEIDLIEELGRLYGYNQLPVRYPQARLAPHAASEAEAGVPAMRRLLVARGYQEVITYSFIDPKAFELFSPGVEPLLLANPISADMSAMRASLWPGLIKVVQHNLNRQQSRVRIFETGLRFVGQLDGLRQEKVIAGAVTGSRLVEAWSNPRQDVDFYDVKADIEALLDLPGGLEGAYDFEPAEHPALHPGQTARIVRAGKPVGFLGTLHPSLASNLGLAQTVLLFELDLAAIAEGALPKFSELSRFPEVRRDFAVVVGRDVPAAEILGAVREAAGPLLQDLKLFDVYHGKGIDPLGKSLAFGLTWQHPSRTLNDEEVNGFAQSVLASLEERFDATLRK